MHLILGGASQGKTEYAKKLYALSDADVFVCAGTEIPADARAVCHLECFVRACTERGLDALKAWDALEFVPEIVICDEIACGVVPINAVDRLWREETGKLLRALAARAEKVTRVFCGLPLELKP